MNTMLLRQQSGLSSLTLSFAMALVAVVAAAQNRTGPPPIEPEIENRIVGGVNVSITKHPHQVSLRMRDCSFCPYFHRCGGSIYRNDFVITAAHCVDQRALHDIVVVAGTNNRNGADGAPASIAKVFLHEQFNASKSDYDVALLLLTTKLPIDHERIAPLKGLVAERPPDNTSVLVTGWGKTTEGGLNSDALNEIEISILSDERCRQAYGRASFTDSMLCAARANKDACQDDSGGPMVSMEKELIGIISWAIGCARPEFPGVYASVPKAKEWIERTVAEHDAKANAKEPTTAPANEAAPKKEKQSATAKQ